MLPGWFNTKELDEFADSVVADLVKRYPPSGQALSGKKTFERLRRTFAATFARMDQFARSHRLNLYKKACFANRVRWALKEAGYPPDFVNTMTQEVVAHMTLESHNKTDS